MWLQLMFLYTYSIPIHDSLTLCLVHPRFCGIQLNWQGEVVRAQFEHFSFGAGLSVSGEYYDSNEVRASFVERNPRQIEIPTYLLLLRCLLEEKRK